MGTNKDAGTQIVFGGIRALLLDRDGVINQDSPDFIKSAEEWSPLPGVARALALLKSANIPVVVCTNQSGIARGLVKMPQWAAMRKKMFGLSMEQPSPIGLIRYCAHGPDEGCRCRKPAPGMLEDACRWLGISPAQALFVGDAERDLLAARAAGCGIALVRTGHGLMTERTTRLPDIPTFDDLLQLVSVMLDHVGSAEAMSGKLRHNTPTSV